MAHQCLKCGRSYPDGSAQILKGCEGCKGTRFFYTDQPLDEPARAALAEKAEIDVDRLTGPSDDDTSAPRRIPTKGELPVGREREAHDWVAGGPAYLRGVVEDVVRRASERKPVFRVGEAPEHKKTLAEWVAEEHARDGSGHGAAADNAPATDHAPEPEAPDLIEDLFAPEREIQWRDDAKAAAPAERSAPTQDPVDAPAAAADEEVVYKRGPRPIPRPVSLAGHAIGAEEDAQLREEAKRARALLDEARPVEKRPLNEASGVEESLYPEGEVPETVQVSGPGVYELDVKRLLEKSPIVVHKDGTYSLHLPSLMETLEGRKKRD